MPQIVYDRDGITLYHGDCLDVLPTLGPVDHVITDPPYAEETHAGARRSRPGVLGSVPLIDFASHDAEALTSALSACLVRRWCVATVDWHHMLALETAPPTGMRFVRFGVWVKPNGAPQFTGDRPGTGWEAVAILHACGGRMRWNGGGNRAVWTVPKENGAHPTQKPLALMIELVRLFTDPGETILDPFAGSGTTLLAARALGRKAIGIERDAHYCDVVVQRLAEPLFEQSAVSPFTQLGLELPA